MSKSEAYARLLELPDNQQGEILGGELVVSPHPGSAQALAVGSVARQLGAFQQSRRGVGGWWILYRLQLDLGEDVLVPFLAGWRTERLPELPDVASLSLPPDWICEVLAPPTAATIRVRKMPIYLREGVSHVWLVDPHARTLETYERAGANWRLAGAWADAEHPAAPPFEAIEMELDDLWIPRPTP